MKRISRYASAAHTSCNSIIDYVVPRCVPHKYLTFNIMCVRIPSSHVLFHLYYIIYQNRKKVYSSERKIQILNYFVRIPRMFTTEMMFT